MSLLPSSSVYGGTDVSACEPSFRTYPDVLYVPHDVPEAASGVFDKSGKLIDSAAVFIGIPQLTPINTKLVSDIDPASIEEVVDGSGLVYGGEFLLHFGHYLLSTLSRYWWTQTRAPATRILIPNSVPPAAYFEYEFIRDTLKQIGLGPPDFIAFPRPVRISELTIPAPSFIENWRAHSAFSCLCHCIGDRITGSATAPTDRPVYLSKARLKSGVSTIVNEQELCDILAQNSVEIVWPETLELAEQVRLFRGRKAIAGTISSALHTSIFSPSSHLVILNHSQVVWSNQILIDKINNNRAEYLCPGDGMTSLGPTDSFGNNFRLECPKDVAYELLERINRA